MSIVLKEALINRGFEHARSIEKTYMLLCLDDTPSFFINIIQLDLDDSEEVITIAHSIKSINEAQERFDRIYNSFAIEGFSSRHTGQQGSSQEESSQRRETGKQRESSEASKENNNTILDDLADLDRSLD